MKILKKLSILFVVVLTISLLAPSTVPLANSEYSISANAASVKINKNAGNKNDHLIYLPKDTK